MSEVTERWVGEEQRRRLERRFGAHVGDWLEELPATLEALATEWDLTLQDSAVPGGRTSVVVYVTLADGRRGVLKLSPDHGLAQAEAQMLRMWAECGRVPEVWELDHDRGAILMERIRGRPLSASGVLPPMATIGALIQGLHSVDGEPEHLAELRPLMARVQFVFDMWGRERAEGPAAGIVPPAVLHQGFNRARDLAHDDVGTVPLHGDLHPGNVIDGGARGLVALDPRACAGDGASDTVDWLMWRITDPAQARQRAEELSKATGMDAERMLDWARAFAPCLAVAMVNRGRQQSKEFETVMELAQSQVP